MFLILRALLPLVLIAGAVSGAAAQTVRIENPAGSVSVEVTSEGLDVQASSSGRAVVPQDVSVVEQPGVLAIKVHPADDARIDLNVKLPYGLALQVRTETGAISLRGFAGSAELITNSGELLLEVPWDASRLRLSASKKPAEVALPEGFRFAASETETENGPLWVLEDRLPEMRLTYGRLRVNAGLAARLTLRHMAIPEDSPVKLPWQAPDILQTIAAGENQARQAARRASTTKNPAAKPTAENAPATAGAIEAALLPEGEAVFSSSVRMVNLTATVYDEAGHPMPGLKASEFTVLEGGVEQEIAFAGAEDVPFNLVLLLDLSGSTQQQRDEMKAAALRFLDITRPIDLVAVYALANDRFHVVSPLTNDREQLRRLIPAIPEVSGGTPLYDALVLSYAQELRQHAGERNAIIVLSDGVDNQIYGAVTPSTVSFNRLRRAARQFDALLYPILLNAAEPGGKVQGWQRRSRERMEALAAATGGRLFPARSLQDLEPVYSQVENELRAVYTVAYYPKGEPLESGWRSVEIKVQRPGARVRSREGYLAQP